MKEIMSDHNQQEYREILEENFLSILIVEIDKPNNILEKIDDSFFIVDTNKQIINAILSLIKKNKTIESIFDIYNECLLVHNNKVDLIRLSQLLNHSISSASINSLYLLLLEFKMKDDLLLQCIKTIEFINSGKKECLDLYTDLSNLMESNINKGRIDIQEDSMDVIMEELSNSINDRILNKNALTGIPTSMAAIDRQLGGLNKKSLIIIAARASMGKTAFVTTIAKNLTLNADIPTAFFSLEMSSTELAQRILSSYTGVPIKAMQTGNLYDEDKIKIGECIDKMKKSSLLIFDKSEISINTLKAKVKEVVEKQKVRVVIVDYLQLMSSNSNKNRNEEIGSISRGLKVIAKENDITVIALAQLSRETDKRPSKEPQLSDLRESGSIEQDADAVIFIHRPEYYGITEDASGNSLKGKAEIIFGKNRRGEKNEKETMQWIGPTNTFMDTVDTITDSDFQDYTMKVNNFFDNEQQF